MNTMSVYKKMGREYLPEGTIVTDVANVKHLLLNDLYDKYLLHVSYITRVTRKQYYTYVEIQVYYTLPRADGSTYDMKRVYEIDNGLDFYV